MCIRDSSRGVPVSYPGRRNLQQDNCERPACCHNPAFWARRAFPDRAGASTAFIRNAACTKPGSQAYHKCMDIRAQVPTDEQLVRQALADRNAFGMLVERYERPLTSYAARLIGRQEAEDVVQQAFLQAYHNLAGFDPHLTFSAWMYRIVHNTAVNMACLLYTSDAADDLL